MVYSILTTRFIALKWYIASHLNCQDRNHYYWSGPLHTGQRALTAFLPAVRHWHGGRSLASDSWPTRGMRRLRYYSDSFNQQINKQCSCSTLIIKDGDDVTVVYSFCLKKFSLLRGRGEERRREARGGEVSVQSCQTDCQWSSTYKDTIQKSINQ